MAAPPEPFGDRIRMILLIADLSNYFAGLRGAGGHHLTFRLARTAANPKILGMALTVTTWYVALISGGQTGPATASAGVR
jgi:hypothetical protein